LSGGSDLSFGEKEASHAMGGQVKSFLCTFMALRYGFFIFVLFLRTLSQPSS